MITKQFKIGQQVYLNPNSSYVVESSKTPTSRNPINVLGTIDGEDNNGTYYVVWSNGQTNYQYEYEDLIRVGFVATNTGPAIVTSTPKGKTKKPTQLTKSKLITLLNDAYHDGFVSSMNGEAFTPNRYTGEKIDALLELQELQK